MVRTLRGAIVVLVVALLGFAAAQPASAAVNPSPSPSASVLGCEDTGKYPAPCTLSVKVATFCSEDVPTLTYDATAVGTNKTKVTITFVNPGGPDLVFADQPLTGTLTFPGVVITNGEVVDWPGWTENADGTWSQGDEFNWVREGMLIHFKVNPEADATATYPGATAACNPPNTEVLAEGDPTPASNSSAVLSATGSNDAPLLAAAIGFIVLGGAAVAMVAISRRRKNA
jgi:hypothetical protein